MIKEELLKTPFVVSRFPSLPCPKCASSLILSEKGRLTRITAGPDFMMGIEGNDPDYYQAVGSILLRCANSSCDESVICTGMPTKVEESQSWDGGQDYEDQIDPRFFSPLFE
jgi:hypothetical protein